MPSTEPFTRRDLHDWLVSRGARPISQRGSHLTVEMPDGVRVEMLDPGGQRTQIVPTVLARRIASVLGLSLLDLRRALGHEPTPSKPNPGNRERRLKVNGPEVEMLRRLQRAAGICAEVGVLPSQREHLRRNLPGLLAELERIAAVPR